MGRIVVNPDVQGAGEFPTWAEGEYELEVTNVQELTSSNGKAMLKV